MNHVSLYGRNHEVQALHDAFEKCFQDGRSHLQQHLVFVHGPSGCGKTALVTQTLRPLVATQRGLFLIGKADATAQWSHPYAVFVSAFQHLIRSLRNNNDESTCRIRDAIREEVGSDTQNPKCSDDARLLSRIVPGFENILLHTCHATQQDGGKQATESGTDASSRLRNLISRLCQTIAKHCPLVLFLDDIQWCNAASLQLLRAILSPDMTKNSTNGGPLMVVCAYRDSAEYTKMPAPLASQNPALGKDKDRFVESETAPLVEFLRYFMVPSNESNSHSLEVYSISLQNVDEATLNEILSGVYGLPQMEFYSQLIFKISSGNIYVALQCVRQLCEEELLYRCEETNEWKWDFSQLQAQDDATAQFLLNPAFSDIVRHSFTQLSESTRLVLRAASCFGMEIEEDVLALLFRDESDSVPSVEQSLEEAIKEGLVVMDPIIGRYAFAHDRVQQEAHALIDDVDVLSFEVGYKLWKRCSPSMIREKILAVVTLLNRAPCKELGTSHDMLPHDDLYAAARLNLEAGEKAMSIAAFSDATEYLERGVSLLMQGGKDGTYWQDEYALALDLLSAAGEVQVFNENFERAEELFREVSSNAKSVDDEYRVIMAKINASSLQGRIQEAVDIGVDFLRLLGENLPSRATVPVLISELIRTKLALRKKSNEVLMTLPAMEDKKKMASADVIKMLFLFSMQTHPEYTVVLATRSIRLGLKHGSFERSATSLTMYAMVLCAVGNVEEGFRYGELAMSLVERHQSREQIPTVLGLFYVGVHPRKRPVREGIEGLKNAVRVAYELGDIRAYVGLHNILAHQLWFAGCNLQKLDQTVRRGLRCRKGGNRQNDIDYDLLQMLSKTIEQLTGQTAYAGVPEFHKSINTMMLYEQDYRAASLFINCGFLAYYFREYQQAHEMLCSLTPELRKLSVASAAGFQVEWIDGLISLAMARERGKKRGKVHLSKAKKILVRMVKKVGECPSNWGHMYDLLKAEYHSMNVPNANCTNDKHSPMLVESFYNSAIEKANEEEFLQVAALASERAGDYMMRLGKGDAAHLYWEKARLLYVKWGAEAKATSLGTLMSKFS